MNLKKIYSKVIAILLITQIGYAQSNTSELATAINTTGNAPDASAILDVQSTDKGVLIPRVSSAQMTAINSPATGLLVYNTTAGSFYFHDGVSWTSLIGGGSGGPSNNIVDGDFDTKVEVDDGTDHDKIIFKIADDAGGSFDAFTMRHNSTLKNTRLDADPYDSNLFIGYDAGKSNDAVAPINSGNNTLVGTYAGRANVTGFRNTFLGALSGYDNSSGYNNNFMGSYAGFENTTGWDNIFMGAYSGYYNISGSSNIFLGTFSGYTNSVAKHNVAIGYAALENNDTGSTQPFHAGNNLALGSYSGKSNTIGSENIFIGHQSGQKNTSGSFNTYVGSNSAINNILGSQNVNIGQGSGRFSTDGDNNVYIGFGAGNSNDLDKNVFIGSKAGDNNEGNESVLIGYEAGFSSSTGSKNIFIGHQAGRNVTGGNKLYIENSSSTSPLIYGDFLTNILRANGTLQVSDPLVNGYAFPASDGTIGQTLTTNGSGALSWTNTSGSPWDTNTGSNYIYTNTNKVGIGTSAPNAVLNISTGSAEPKAILINNTNANGTGVLVDMNAVGQNSSSVKGILSQAQPKAYAGYFEGRLETTTVLNLEEKNSAPINTNSYAGDIYMDNGNNTNNNQRGLRYYNGSAWEDVASETVSFSAKLASSVTTTSGSSKEISGYTETFDEGNDFNPTTGEFTAPSNGVYQFQLKIAWDASSNLDDKRFITRIKVNGNVVEQKNSIISLQTTWNNSITFSPIRKLNANDKVIVEVLQYSSNNLNVFGSSVLSASTFQGIKIK